MFDFATPILLSLLMLGLTVSGVMIYKLGAGESRDEAELLKYENEALRSLITAMRVCMDDDADARTCPLYDDNEPNRCAMWRVMEELGLRDDD